jgi:micrococcal nuclease
MRGEYDGNQGWEGGLQGWQDPYGCWDQEVWWQEELELLMFEYQARLMRVVDGDTIDLDIDLGFNVHVIQSCRLNGCNAPEKNTPEGVAAKTYVQTWFAANVGQVTPFKVQTYKKEKYGRYLVDVGTLVRDLIFAGHAVAWDGHGPRPV